MADDLGERSEEATPRRLQQAREEGNVSKSMDLAGAMLLLVGTLVTAAATMPALRDTRLMMETLLDFSRLGGGMHESSIDETLSFTGLIVLRVLGPALFGIWIAAYIAHVWQVGFLFSAKAVAPSLKKLNPLEGAKRIFGISGVMKATLDALKVVVVLIVAAQAIIRADRELIGLPQLTAIGGVALVARLLFSLALQVVAALIILGILDFVYQRWKYSRDLRMTKQQVKDEHKQLEGDPEVKKRRMRMQQQIAMQRIGAAVPQADVIVTNPEHISIAIQYDPKTMSAPKVIAKGADFLALRIRQLATQHGVPIVERKPLARAMYKDVSVGQEVPPQFYQAVAEILAYVFRLSGRAAG